MSSWTLETCDAAIEFDRDVAPILVEHCISCHSGSEPKGMLNLTRHIEVTRGGDSGPAVIAHDLDKSPLWQLVDAEEMPPKQKLSKHDRDTLRTWIVEGAVWGTDPIDTLSHSSDHRAGYDWWSLQPIVRPKVPDIVDTHHPIDSFVLQRLSVEGLLPSPTASPRQIIRRMSFDLIGLPPTPIEIQEFELAFQTDADDAVSDLIARLLSSPHFGERWGRHWLDVVRFGESQGFERDRLREDSWYYRDWVIQALNNDMPYDQFVRLQIAGDIMMPGDPDAITATGFLVAGAWDEVGQSMQSAAMKKVVRQDEVEDYVGTIGQAFLGLTINCARCHDHKFDPISQREYYRIAAAVAGVHHGSRQVITEFSRRRSDDIRQEIRRHSDAIAAIESTVRTRLIEKNANEAAPSPLSFTPIARWTFDADLTDCVGDADAAQNLDAKVETGRLILDQASGYAKSAPLNITIREKTLEAWVRLENLDQRGGGVISVHGTDGKTFDAIVYGEREPGRWMAGSDFFQRTQSFNGEIESTADREFVHVAIAWHADGTIAGYRNGKPYGQNYQADSPLKFNAGEWFVLFGLRCAEPASERQLSGMLEAAQLYDRALTADEIKRSYEQENHAINRTQVLAALTDDERQSRETHLAAITALKKENENHQPHDVYAASPSVPDATFVLTRGNPGEPTEPVTAGGIAAVKGVQAEFGIEDDASDADRRRSLADWIANRNNPLFARVIVNRLWHYHFGSGLVDTPNDFGFSGGRPSHPELLDYLASELIDSGFRLKHIHQLIVSSQTYLQSSLSRLECVSVDADNRLLWRKNPTRLDAETLRDTILSVSGQLNSHVGGPPYRDFKTYVHNSQFYEMTDEDSPDVYRRTVYRTWIRSGRNHLLDVFDCPDPSTTAPKRSTTITPLQALSLMNNSFILRMADRFAARAGETTNTDAEDQTLAIYQLAYGRLPSAEELNLASDFISKHGTAAFCRVIINSNEFIHVD